MADIFHTFFGICGLSLLGYFGRDLDSEKYSAYKVTFFVYFSRVDLMNNSLILLQDVDPTYALPVDLVEALGLARQVMPELVMTGDLN